MEALEAAEVPVKRTYQKHKTEKKLSIVHFLNTKVKPISIESELYYPLYVRITKERKNTTIKSLIWGYFSKKMLDKITVSYILNLEKNYILRRMIHTRDIDIKDPEVGFSYFTAEYRENSNMIRDNIHKYQLNLVFSFFKKAILKIGGSANEHFDKIFSDLAVKTLFDLEQDPAYFTDILAPLITEILERMVHDMKFSEIEFNLILDKSGFSEKLNQYIKNVG